MMNPPSVATISTDFKISTYSSAGFIVDEGTAVNSFASPIEPHPIPFTVERQSTLLSSNAIYQLEFTIVN